MTHPGIAHGALAQARSFLFVPANRFQRLPKAIASGADAVILDLEDAVPPDARAEARQAIRAAWGGIADGERARLLLRINGADTPWHPDDVELLAELAALGLGGVMLAKAEGAAALSALAVRAPGMALLPLVESGAGMDTLDAIAGAPGVLRLALGHLDLQADLGLVSGPAEAELAPARWEIVRATRRAGLAPPVDGVTMDLHDTARVAQDCARSLRWGFSAKLCIHPAQVGAVHEAFRPSAEEAAQARRVLAAADAAHGGVCMLDGRMVDAPVIALARRVLARIR